MKKIILALSMMSLSIAGNAQSVTIGSGTRVDSNIGLSTPISIYYGYSLSQQLYTAAEIGTPMTIKTIQFYLKPSTSTDYGNTAQIDVWIGHTSQNQLNADTTTGAAWIPVAQQTKVISNGTMSVTNDIATFTLDTPFVYNGTDNLVITFDENKSGHNGSSHPFYQTVDGPNIVTFVTRSDTANPDPTNPPSTYSGPNSTSTSETQSKVYKPIITLSSNLLAVNEIATESDFKIFTNENGNTLDVLSGNSIKNVEIYDAKGSLVVSGKLENKSIRIDRLNHGVYTIKAVFKDGKTAVKKFVK